MTEVWSCGGGTQSAAIAALIVHGKLPKPDISLIVDTNREKTSTWEYLDAVIAPALSGVGVKLERIDSSQFRTCDLWSTNDGNLLLPVFTAEGSKAPAFCSNEWKRRVALRWLRTQGIEEGRLWMGISTNEISRVRTPFSARWPLRYPLIFDTPMSRQDCINLIASMGWPEAPRSSCWMCPHMRDAEWREMRKSHPEDFNKAVSLEREIHQREPNVFLHDSLRPLEEVDFTYNQLPLFDPNGCASGMCWV